MKRICVLLALIISSFQFAADVSMCRAKATDFYNDCLSGAVEPGGGNACRTQTRCEDLCLGGKRICRVFDCHGLILSSYDENCLEQPKQFKCGECRENGIRGSGWEFYARYCYQVWDVTNGARLLVQDVCSDFEYKMRGLDTCFDLKRDDPRCD